MIHGAGPDMIPGAAPPPPPEAPPPPAALSGPRHAADTIFDDAEMAAAREDLRSDQGEFRTLWLMVDQLEARIRDGEDGYLWDAQGWYGGDINKFWFKTEGERSEEQTSELQSLMRISYAVLCLKKKKISTQTKCDEIYDYIHIQQQLLNKSNN